MDVTDLKKDPRQTDASTEKDPFFKLQKNTNRQLRKWPTNRCTGNR